MQPHCCVSFVSVFVEPTKMDSARIDVSPYGETMDDIGLEHPQKTLGKHRWAWLVVRRVVQIGVKFGG